MRTTIARTRDLLAPFIVLGVLAGCTASDRRDGGSGEQESPPSPPSTTRTERAFRLKMGDGPQLPLDSFRIDTTDPQLRASLEESGCAEVVAGSGSSMSRGGGGGGGGAGKASFVTSAVPTGGLAEWAADEVAGRPHASSASIFLKTKDIEGELTCVIELGELKLDRLALRGSNDAPQLAWEISSARASARPPAGERIDEIAAEPTTAAMLLPAVQKVRTAAQATSSDEGGYPLYVAGGGAPPPFDLVLGEEDTRAVFPHGTGGPRRAILELASPSAAVGFVLDLDTVLDPSGRARATVRSIPAVLADASAPHDAATASVAALRAAAPSTADEATAGRLLVLLDGRPTPTGSLGDRRAAIADYWNGNNRRSTFDTLLGTFFTVARDEEGAWAYTRLISSARTFAALDPKSSAIAGPSVLRSRLVASAALLDLERAAFPMALPQASNDATLSAHDYGMALTAVARLGEAGPLLVAAKPSELAGILPEEIDVAVAVEAERTPDTTVAADASHRFGATLDVVLGAGSVTENDLTQLESDSKALRDAITALQDVTLVRFEVSRGPR